MRLTRTEFNALIDKYLAGTASEEEVDLLSRYYNSFQQSSNWDPTEMGHQAEVEAKLFKRILEKLEADGNLQKHTADYNYGDSERLGTKPTRKTKVFVFLRLAAAACLAGLIIYGGWRYMRPDEKEKVATAPVADKAINNDVDPGGDKAVLMLGDGRSIVLDDVQNGALAQQGATQVIKIDGRLNYDASAPFQEVHYNTLSTPKGGKYQVALADGTKVWLNAASSLYFPTAFVGKERRVVITGEAYFEVAENKAMPFIVSVKGAEIQVLGTQFNVMAYDNEASLKTTLIEGSVQFVKNDIINHLKPGQQLQFQKSGKIIRLSDADMQAVLAWKNGVFQFHNTELQDIMRQLERWYDIEVDENKMPAKRFNGNIARDVPLSKVLQMMEVTSGLHFKIENQNKEGKLLKKVTITQ